jgi:hypothetical protein
MNDRPGPKIQPASAPSAVWSATRSAIGAMLATAFALGYIVLAGMLFWSAIRGFLGVAICGALGAAMGACLRRPGSRLARVVGGGVGGTVAGLFAIAAAEMFPPATIKWACAGGASGALFGLPVAAIVGGLVGLLSALFHSSTSERTSASE